MTQPNGTSAGAGQQSGGGSGGGHTPPAGFDAMLGDDPDGTGPDDQNGAAGDNAGANGNTGAGDNGDEGDEYDIDSLPPAAQKKIRDLERDNHRYRRQMREARNGQQRGSGTTRTGSTTQPAATGNGAGQTAGSTDDVQAQIAAAAAQARADARAEYAENLAGSRIEAALTQLGVEDADEIVEGLNLSRFVTQDGEVDREAVKAHIDRFKSLMPKRRRNVGQGGSGGTGTAKTKYDLVGDALGIS